MACLSRFEWRKFTTPKIGHIIHWLKWLSFRPTIHFRFGLELGPMVTVWGLVVVHLVSSEGFERTINKRLVLPIQPSWTTQQVIGTRARVPNWSASRISRFGNPRAGLDKSMNKSFRNVTAIVIKILEKFYERNKSEWNKENLSIA